MNLDPQTLGPIIGIAIFVAIMGFRLMRGRKPRPLKLEWMWLMPAVLVLVAGSLIWQLPPRGLEWLWLAIALLVGAAIGWQRGRMMTITVNPETHALNQQASPAAMIFLLALVGVRYGLREGLQAEAQAWHLSVAFITDLFVVFALGLLTVTRLEMFLRARRLLDDAQAAGKVAS
ncbi:MAG: DUF1453 family protein [Caulobacter sp.]|nr:DUF1453 family protein [Caulobacter sp.]